MTDKRPVLEYYLDEGLTKRIPVNEIGQPLFDWGEVQAGQKKEKTVYIKNMTNDRVTIRQPYSKDEDFTIKYYPVTLKGQESSIMKFEYCPAWNRTTALESHWGFDLVIG